MREYEDNFLIASEFTIVAEGGLNEDKRDAGGVTNHGISIVFLEDYAETKKGHALLTRIGVDTNVTRQTILDLTQEQAKEIYYHAFWLDPQINQLPLCLAIPAYDLAVNAGVAISVKILQRAIGTTADGIIGNQTLAKAHDCDIKTTIKYMLDERVAFYKRLGKLEKYSWALKGWLNRARNIKRFLEDKGCL